MMDAVEQKIVEAATEKDGKKRLPCPQAFKLSEDHGVPLKEIGAICNRNDIKIVSCQLGCFK